MHAPTHSILAGGRPAARPLSIAFADRAFGLRALCGLRIREWRRRMRERHEISGFGERDLRDICLDRCVAEQEVRKPFWRR
jgi:uncharacterized protein YjiS (DUF1127 family)